MKKLKPEEKQAKELKAKKTYTLRFYMLILSGAISVVGVGLFVLYFFMPNMAVGVLGFTLIVVGGFLVRHYWQKEGGISVEHIGGIKKDVSANSLNIYPGRAEFANVKKPRGFPMLCVDLKKSFYVNIWNEASKKLGPFVLPDQQYYDPNVFAQRVLGLPAHRKIFERKPKLIQKLKTALLIVAIGIVWLLILTTTEGS